MTNLDIYNTNFNIINGNKINNGGCLNIIFSKINICNTKFNKSSLGILNGNGSLLYVLDSSLIYLKLILSINKNINNNIFNGGSITGYNANINILNSIFINDTTNNNGGSIYIKNCNLNLTNIRFKNCYANKNGCLYTLYGNLLRHKKKKKDVIIILHFH